MPNRKIGFKLRLRHSRRNGKVEVRPYGSGTSYTGIIVQDVGYDQYVVKSDQTGLENREYGSTLTLR